MTQGAKKSGPSFGSDGSATNALRLGNVPVSQGGNSQFSVGTTMTWTTSADIAPGTFMIIGFYSNSGTSFQIDIIDPAGSNWQTAILDKSGAPEIEIRYAFANGRILAGSTMTAVNNNSASRYGAIMASLTGVPSSSALDKAPAVTRATAANATSISTGTLSQVGEIVFGLVVSASSFGTFTPGGAFCQIASMGGSAAKGFLCYQPVDVTTAVSWAPSWSGGSILHASAACSFKFR